MKQRRSVWIGAMLTAVLLAGVALWGYGYLRRVDGRSPAQWLAYADFSSRTLSYHAEGHSWTAGLTSHFVLDQGRNGCYSMSTRDVRGQQCTLGFDGRQLWYTAGSKLGKIAVAPTPQSLNRQRRSRILGTAIMAGRPVVRLAVKSGAIRKTLAIDRATGIILAMTTQDDRQLQSTMVVDHIDYRDVAAHPCPCGCGMLAQHVDHAVLATQLGGTVYTPHWLPAGMSLTDMLAEPCPECGQPMGVLRYSDGITAITIFEMAPNGMMCAMGNGCTQTADAHAIVAHATVNGYAITAVGTLDAATLNKVLASMQ